MTIKDFYAKLTELYPVSLSCEWDNDGLMCCYDSKAEVKKVLTALDCTNEVLEYAAANGFDTVITHHPMIFKGLCSITDTSLVSNKVIFCIKNRINVISLHTRLDAGKNGVNDCLAEKLGLTEIEFFGDDESPELGRIGTAGIDFIETVKSSLGLTSVTAYITRDIHRVAVVGGSGKDYIKAAVSAGADTFVTGECSYNYALDAADMGLNIIEAGHYHTEFPVCAHLAELAETIAGAKAEVYTLKYPTQL